MAIDWKEKQATRDQLVEKLVQEIGASGLPCACVEEIPSLLRERLNRAMETQQRELEFKAAPKND